MSFNPVILSIPIYFILIAAELIYDRLAKKNMYRLGDAYANIGCGIFEQVTGIFAKVFTVGLYAFVYYHWRVTTIPVTAFSIIALWIGVDFFYYWAHRWSHEINLFWVGHVVHHQSEDYNLSVALRQGALQKFFTAPVFLPLALLGFSPEWFLFVGALNTVYQFWIHTETIDKMGWFGLIFNTPSHHRVHHGRNPKYIDKNHAGSLIIWDKMFGTFQAEEETPNYGITKPVYTFNPVMAHIKAIKDLVDDVKKQSGINKLKVIFYGPGWQANPQEKPSENATTSFRKFTFTTELKLQRYIFWQILLLLAFTAFFLFQYTQLNLTAQVLSSSFIIYSLFSLGYLNESKKHAFWLDSLKWPLLVYTLFVLKVPNIYLISAAVLAAISIVFLFFVKPKKNHDSQPQIV